MDSVDRRARDRRARRAFVERRRREAEASVGRPPQSPKTAATLRGRAEPERGRVGVSPRRVDAPIGPACRKLGGAEDRPPSSGGSSRVGIEPTRVQQLRILEGDLGVVTDPEREERILRARRGRRPGRAIEVRGGAGGTDEPCIGRRATGDRSNVNSRVQGLRRRERAEEGARAERVVRALVRVVFAVLDAARGVVAGLRVSACVGLRRRQRRARVVRGSSGRLAGGRARCQEGERARRPGDGSEPDRLHRGGPPAS